MSNASSKTAEGTIAKRDTSEGLRLQALQSYQVLDTPPEPIFDDLTTLAAALFQTPMAVISFMDGRRRFFKSHFGLDITEVPLEFCFGTEAILAGSPFILLDTHGDPLFRDNPHVTGGPRIRFYASVPLISNGVILGTFCILDTEPRDSFSAEELTSLQRFASLATNALEQRMHPAQMASVEREILATNERYRLATQATTEGIWDWDCTTGQMYQSGRMRAIIGLEPSDGYMTIVEWLGHVHPDDRPSIFSIIGSMLSTSLSNTSSDYRVQHRDGTWRWVRSRTITLRDHLGSLTRVVGSLADITSTKCVDELTGLHTRVSISQIIERRVAATPDHPGQFRPFTLLIVDLDLFKRINISLGRAGGDALLVECGRRISQTIALMGNDAVAHIHGGEFAIFLDSIPSEEDAMMYAECLQPILTAPIYIHGRQITVTASIGIVRCTEAIRAEVLLQQAEAAAHQSKLEGGARSVVFFQQLQDRVLRRMSLATDLREALTANALELHYQPKYDLATEQITGFEALARWHHPVQGFISPEEFVSIAEESELILDLGRWTLRHAIGQLAEWRNAGLVGMETTMAVNLSARQFSDSQLTENLVRKLKINGVPATCLSLEVTEGILILDTEAALKTLEKIKALGCGLDLDDFGTGYSSLSYLQRFPFDALKIDRSFVSHLEQEPDRAVLVRSIIALGHSLGLEVVAEGIETSQQLTMLKAMGCNSGQGYLFSKPLAAAAIESFLAAQKPSAKPRVPVAVVRNSSARPN